MAAYLRMLYWDTPTGAETRAWWSVSSGSTVVACHPEYAPKRTHLSVCSRLMMRRAPTHNLVAMSAGSMSGVYGCVFFEPHVQRLAVSPGFVVNVEAVVV